MKKIGLVLANPPAYSETFFNAKIKGLQDAGHEVILFVASNPKNFNLCKVVSAPKIYKNPILQVVSTFLLCIPFVFHFKNIRKFIVLERKSNRSWLQIYKNIYANFHILSAKIDWLHFGFATLAIQSENVAAAINAKMGVSLRGFDMDVFPLKQSLPYSLLWQRTNKVHAISNHMLKRAQDLGLSINSKSKIIYPAIEIANFKCTKTQKKEAKLHIVTIARLHWIKGLSETLEALAILKKQGLDFQYTIIGEGKEREQLQFAIYQLKLEDCVVLLGQKTPKEVINKLNESDLYLQYSYSEGFCNAVLEAQAMRLLCVVSDGGALPENVIDQETGWVVPKRKPELLAQKILNVMQLSETEKEKIKNQARLRVEKHFTLKQQQKAFVDFYTEL